MNFINKQDHNIYMLYKYIQFACEDQDNIQIITTISRYILLLLLLINILN